MIREPLIPDFIAIQDAQGRQRGSLEATTLFVDISGFTALSEELMKRGKRGAEALAEALRFYFDPLVNAVHGAGGFITNFAGDAFIALFPDASEGSLRAAVQMQAFFSRHACWEDEGGSFSFGLKVGLSHGLVQWGIIELSKQRALYYFRGQGIDGCTFAESHASRGDIILHQPLLDRLSQVPVEALDGACFRYVGPLEQEPVAFAPQAEPTAQAPLELARFFPRGVRHFPRQGEWRKVVVVFLSFDFVESLPLFVRFLYQQLQRYGGTFSSMDFGDKGGTCLFFFGAPTAHENDLQRAFDFCLAIKGEAHGGWELRAGVTEDRMYVGFNGGEARHEFACLGRAVNLAARLMTRAPWGEFWCPPALERRASAQYLLEERGTHELKGFAEPVALFALEQKRHTTRRDLTNIPLVGRREALAQLQKAVAPIFDGSFAGLIYVDGEPGMGKSLLVERLQSGLQSAQDERPLSWLFAPCEPILRQPFAPFAYALREFVGFVPGQEQADNRARFDEALGELTGQLSEAEHDLAQELQRTHSILAALIGIRYEDSLYERLEPEMRLSNTMLALQAWLQAQSLRQPLVLQIEDGQWLDPHSQEALVQLCRSCAGFPIALLFTCRYLDDGSPFRIPREEHTPLRELQLSRFDKEGIETLARAQLDGEISPELVALLHERSAGNPFFAAQILHYLRENEGLSEGPQGYSAADAGLIVPDDAHAILVARLDRLSVDVKQTVQAAAVLGREFDGELVSHMLSAQAQRQLQAAQEQQIWSELQQAQYLFLHALLRDTAYDMQPQARLRQLHAQAAEAFEALRASHLSEYYHELAHHYEHASLREKAVEYLVKAGEAAAEASHNSEAVGHFKRALRLLPDAGESTRQVALAVAKAHRLLGHWEACITHCELALGACPEPSADAHREWADALIHMGEVEAAESHVQQAAAIAEAQGYTACLATCYKVYGLIAWHRGELDMVKQHYERSIALFREIQDVMGEGRILNNMGNLFYQRGALEEASHYYEQSLEKSRLCNDLHCQTTILANFANVRKDQGDFEESQKLFREGLSIARQIGSLHRESSALGGLGLLALNTGHPAEALAWMEEACLALEKNDDKTPDIPMYRVEALRRLGRLDEAEALFAPMPALVEAFGNPDYIARAHLFEGHLLRDRGDREGARAAYESTLCQAQEIGIARLCQDARRALDALEADAPIPDSI